MTDVLAQEPADRSRAAAVPIRRRRAVAAAAGLLLIVAVLAVLLAGSGGNPPDTGASTLVPADALAYINVSLDRGRPPVGRALRMAGRFPDYPLASAAIQTRLGTILAGGKSIDFGSQILPWLGNEAALALLNTATSTAGSLVILDVRNPARARAFLRGEGAAASGSDRGTRLYSYSSGSEVAFLSHYLVLGQDASVRAAIDVSAGASPSLAGSSAYQRASANEPDGRVLDAYASLAGVERVLSPQGGLLGALGGLLYQPALQGVAMSLSPAAGGARVLVHSALDPSLAKLSHPAKTAFTPTLQSVMPAGSILMLDVRGLNRVAPQVLNAGAAAGVAGGIGPLLTRLGGALRAEGVNTQGVTSIFAGETAVAIVPHAHAPTLVVVARTPNVARTQRELAQLEVPLAQLFKPSKAGSGQVPQFVEHSVGGVTDHQLVLASGLEVDYAVFRGLVVISTSAQGVAAVAQRTRTLAADPGFRFALGSSPGSVTSLVYADLPELLALGTQTGLTSSARYQQLKPDLAVVRSVGLTSTRSGDSSTARLSIRVP
jgi:hypothetical protein